MLDDIFTIIQSAISNRAEFFLSEREIQLFLARKLETSGNFDKIFLEYSVPVDQLNNQLDNYPWTNDKISIDIVVEKEGKFVPVEIKYKTESQETNYQLFGTNVNITLAEHAAINNACYDFWKDVKRIEIIKESFQDVVEGGLVIFVTNHSRYWKGPREHSNYFEFNVKDVRTVQTNDRGMICLSWRGNGFHETRTPKIELRNNYTLTWVDAAINSHKLLMLKIV